jgi:hypothetical protein
MLARCIRVYTASTVTYRLDPTIHTNEIIESTQTKKCFNRILTLLADKINYLDNEKHQRGHIISKFETNRKYFQIKSIAEKL